MSHEFICLYCRKVSTRTRKSKRFCSNTCRVKYNDLPKRVDNQLNVAWRAIQELKEIVVQFPHLSSEIDDVLENIRSDAWSVQKSIDRLTVRSQQNLKHGGMYWQCEHCGQSRYIEPIEGTKCGFCGEEKWTELET